MRSLYFNRFALLFCGTSAAYGLSLYDMAPAVGLPESQALTYTLTLRAGVDTNPACSSNRTKHTNAFTNASLGAIYRDVEAADKLEIHGRVGATYYFGDRKGVGNGEGKRWASDCNLGGTLTHAFDARSKNVFLFNTTFKPEPDYDNGISAHSRRGDNFTWDLRDTYYHAIDDRWSWNIGANYNGSRYEEKSYFGYNDDRQYIGGSLGLSYRTSDLTSYSLNGSATRRLRQHGLNSTSYSLTLGLNRAIDSVSSFNVSAGAQCVAIGGENRISPTVSAAYNRQVADGLKLRAYVRYSNENVDSYRGSNLSYKDVLSWRMGFAGTYTLTPDVTFSAGSSALFSSYRHGQGKLPGEKRSSYDGHVSMNYKFNNHLSADITCRYNTSHYNRKVRKERYDRIETSCGLHYNF